MNETTFTKLEKIIESDYKNIVGLQVSHDGTMMYEKYWNQCTADRHYQC